MKFYSGIALTLAAVEAVDNVEGSADANNCMNDAWEANADGVCQPKAEYFALRCNSDGMAVEMDPLVVPNAMEVSIGSCQGTLENGQWNLATSLDGCSTGLATNDDGTLSFDNTLRANSYNTNSIIYTSNTININVACSYANHYNDIEVETTVVGSDVNTDQDGQGHFSFNLEMFNDADMMSPVGENDVTTIGEPLYFKLSQQFPVAGVVFAIDDCVVKDDSNGQEYKVIENQCADVFVNTVLTPASGDMVNFSYTAFQFVQNSEDTESTALRLVCSAYVCNENDPDSTCQMGCQARKRRSVSPAEKKYHVSINMHTSK